MSSGPGLLCAERRSVGGVACLLPILCNFSVTLSPYTFYRILLHFLNCYTVISMLIAFPFIHTSFLSATFPYYGRISPFIPLIPFYLSIPPIIPPSFPFSPFPPVSPFAAVSRGFSGLFGLFRWSRSGPGGAGSAGGCTCLLAAVRASVMPSSAVPLVLRVGPLAVLPGLPPFCACSGSGAPFFRACLFRARGAGRIVGRRAAERTKKRSGGACSASSLLGLYSVFRASFHFPAARARMIINAQIKQ